MSHFRKMKLVPFNSPMQQPDLEPLINPIQSALKSNIIEKSDILSSDIPSTKKNNKLNKNIQSFKVLTKNILNKTENKKKSIKLENSVENKKRKPIKSENLSSQVKKIKLEPIISDIKPTQRRSSRLFKKIKNKSKPTSYKKHLPPKIVWEST